MSPEQAEMSQLGIDTRSDIYSLGALLYELLTGSTPLERERLRSAAFTEMLRMIKQEEPPRPSARLTDSKATLASLATQRRMEPAKLAKLVQGELDWIVMKCLEKDRTRRYETANGLARDLQRYLADEPVEACPPSTGYKLKKFARRYRNALVTATAFLLLLVAAVVVSAWLAVRATLAEAAAREGREAAQKAESQARDERDAAAAAERRAKQERVIADNERRRAEASEAKVQHSLYIANMNRVRFELEQFNVGRARELLDLYRHPRNPENDLRGWEWYYWDRACRGELYTQEAHSGPVTAIAFSPDGSRVVSAGGEGEPTIKLWDTVSGQELWSLAGPKEGVRKVAFSSDGLILATCSSAGVTLWEVRTGKKLRTLTPDGKAKFGPAAFSPDWKTLTVEVNEGGKRAIKFRDMRGEKWLEDLPQITVTTRLVYSPDGKLLAQMHPEGVNLWDVVRRTVLYSFADHQFASYSTPANTSLGITGLAFSPDGRILATCGMDGTAKLRDIPGGRTVHALAAHALLKDLTFSPDGQSVIAAGTQGFLASWEVGSGRAARTFLGTGEDILCIAASSDGTRLASGSMSGKIQMWDATAGPTQRLSLGWQTAGVATFSPDGKMLAYPYFTRGVEVRDLANARPPLHLVHRAYDESAQDMSGIRSIAFSPDSKLLATTCWHPNRETGKPAFTIRLWDLERGRVDRSFQGFTKILDRLVFSPDGRTLAFRESVWEGGRPVRQIRLWDLTTGTQQRSFPGVAMSFSPDGRGLAVVGNDGVLKLTDRNGGGELLTLKGRTNPQFVTFSRDGKRLFFDGSVWEVDGGREICHLQGDDALAYFSPDGKRLFAAASTPGARATLRVWDAGAGDLLLAIDVPGGILAVHPDGWQMASSRLLETWLVDARPWTPELRQQHEAQSLVAYLFRRPMLKKEVVECLRGLKTISEPLRREAMVLAQLQEQDTELLNVKSVDILIHSDRTPEEYRSALKWAEEAHRLEPEAGTIANTYGVALYYAGRYEEAVAALERSRRLNLRASQENHYVYDLLFLAMAQWKSGRHEEARATLKRARDPKLPQHEVLPRHWREAEALIEGKVDEPKK
jgi:WD40 repeat protein